MHQITKYRFIDKFTSIKFSLPIIKVILITCTHCPHIYLGQSNFAVIVKRFEFYSLINFAPLFGLNAIFIPRVVASHKFLADFLDLYFDPGELSTRENTVVARQEKAAA